ncbi:MAG: Holliday junction resolvase RuvX [Myxococcota bacterium]
MSEDHPSGRLLGLDPGTRRIGVAVSDDLQWFARPLEVIRRSRKGLDQAVERLGTLIEELEIVELVVGVPYRLDGSTSASTEMALGFIEVLSKTWPKLPIVARDETLTSWEAEQILEERGIKGRGQRDLVDAFAAAVILQELLDERRSSGSD